MKKNSNNIYMTSSFFLENKYGSTSIHQPLYLLFELYYVKYQIKRES